VTTKTPKTAAPRQAVPELGDNLATMKLAGGSIMKDEGILTAAEAEQEELLCYITIPAPAEGTGLLGATKS
jgi:hypothetical protein